MHDYLQILSLCYFDAMLQKASFKGRSFLEGSIRSISDKFMFNTLEECLSKEFNTLSPTETLTLYFLQKLQNYPNN